MTQPNEDGPKIWIVSTGTEILQGHYADSNAQWLCQELLGIGFGVSRIMALPDHHDILAEELGQACRRCDLIIMTGGLGPTADDMNREAVAGVFGLDLVQDDQCLDEIRERFTKRGRPMAPSNAVQAQFPRGAEILHNPWGTAPGFLIAPPEGSELRASLLALPGPPREMKPMFTQMAAEKILSRFGAGRRVMRTLTLHTVGLPEGTINDRIEDLFDSDPKVNVALLAGRWRVDVRLTLKGESEEENLGLEERWRDLILERLGPESIWGEGPVEFAEVVGNLLRERGQTLALAESCTGGLIAKQITDVPGCSDYFLEGFVTYANQAKIDRLGVPAEVIAEKGAVSAEAAAAMAEGARKASGADWALSVTGIAGPGGATPEKPVGLIFFGLAYPNGRVKTRRVMGFRGREAVRGLSAVTGLDILRRAILRYEA